VQDQLASKLPQRWANCGSTKHKNLVPVETVYGSYEKYEVQIGRSVTKVTKFFRVSKQRPPKPVNPPHAVRQ
jgi:hypothetical protein